MNTIIIAWGIIMNLRYFMLSACLLAAPVYAGFSDRNMADDCYQAWQSQNWRIGENATPATKLTAFRESIKKICQLRAEMFAEGEDISPFIQGNLRQVAPLVFKGDEADFRAHIRQIASDKRQALVPPPDYLSE